TTTFAGLLGFFGNLRSRFPDQTREVERTLDARRGKEVKRTHNYGAGSTDILEAGHEQYRRVPEKTPEADRDPTFHPAGQGASQLVHRPHPECCHHGSDAEQVVQVRHLEGAQDIPCGSETGIGTVYEHALGADQNWHFLICSAVLFRLGLPASL